MDYSGPQTDPNDSTNTSRLDVQNCSIHSQNDSTLKSTLNSQATRKKKLFTEKTKQTQPGGKPSGGWNPFAGSIHLLSSPQEVAGEVERPQHEPG